MALKTSALIGLRDKNVYPDEAALRQVLGISFGVYAKLCELFGKTGCSHEWRYYNDGKAWLCKVQHKKRTIVWMSAWTGFVKATVYMPEKAVDKLYTLPIKKNVIENIRSAKTIGKSRACVFEIRSEGLIGDFEEVMKLKIAEK